MAKTKRTKKDGQIFTPNPLVCIILDAAGYSEVQRDLELYDIIDNSCGDGAFLMEVVRRLINSCRTTGMSDEQIASVLSTKVHGIEIDTDLWLRCQDNLDNICEQMGLQANVKWDIVCADALTVHKYDGKMDFVVGNPPYVRVHNLGNELKLLRDNELTKKGNTDLYISFYELGLRMMKETGVLAYVTPNSWLTSLSGQELRNRVLADKMLNAVIDFGHYQWFEGVCVYSTVAVMMKNSRDCLYFTWNKDEDGTYRQAFVAKYDNVEPAYNIKGKFYFGTPDDLNLLREVKTAKVGKYFEVKNGLATLADDIFVNSAFQIGNFFYREIWKSSKGEPSVCIYPYDEEGVVFPLEFIKQHDYLLYNYFMDNKAKLESRSLQKGTKWWEYGRTQAIGDTRQYKMTINNLVKDAGSVKPCLIGRDVCSYGGLYVISADEEFDSVRLHQAKRIVGEWDFIRYIMLLRKYKSGGYYTFNGKDAEEYLNYVYSKRIEQFKWEHLKENSSNNG